MPTTSSAPAAAAAPAAYDGFDRMLLNGRWTHGGSGQSVDDLDPYSNEVLLRIPLADQADLDDAEEFTTVHWISVQHEPVPYPF
jgi:hypothetical protein